MNDTTEPRSFVPVRIAVLTVSDSRILADDRSGDTLVERIARAGHLLADRAILRDEKAQIVAKLKDWVSDPGIDAVITTGGTGLTGRDVTVEAHEAVYEKTITGFATLFAMVSFRKIARRQSRAAPAPGWPMEPTSSRYRARRGPAGMPGMKSSNHSSISATAPATSWKSCPASKNTAGESDHRRVCRFQSIRSFRLSMTCAYSSRLNGTICATRSSGAIQHQRLNSGCLVSILISASLPRNRIRYQSCF